MSSPIAGRRAAQVSLAKIETGAQRIKLAEVGELAGALKVPVAALITPAPTSGRVRFDAQRREFLELIATIDVRIEELRATLATTEAERQPRVRRAR